MKNDNKLKQLETIFKTLEVQKLVSDQQLISTTYFALCNEAYPHLEKIFGTFNNLKEEIEKYEGEKFNILSLACGNGVELYFLQKFLGPHLFHKINYVGIDIAGDSLYGLGTLNSVLTHLKIENAKFHSGDATNLTEITSQFESKDKINFIILRHPQFAIGEFDCPFRKMISHIMPRLPTHENLKILITTFYEDEKQIAMECLKNSAQYQNKNYKIQYPLIFLMSA